MVFQLLFAKPPTPIFGCMGGFIEALGYSDFAEGLMRFLATTRQNSTV